MLSSLALLLLKAANIVIMGVCGCTALEISVMQDQKLLTLCSDSELGRGSDIGAGISTQKGGHYCDHGCTTLDSP